jgi:hypothetical protein
LKLLAVGGGVVPARGYAIPNAFRHIMPDVPHMFENVIDPAGSIRYMQRLSSKDRCDLPPNPASSAEISKTQNATAIAIAVRTETTSLFI